MKSLNHFDSLVKLSPGKKIYFASDFHLGAPDDEISKQREKKIIKWLEQIKNDASAIFLVGDLFDFWFEYKHAIPKGFIRFQGKLAELVDTGIPIFIFTGNHDLWYKDYFSNELGIPVFDKPISLEIVSKSFLVGHGDGLGDGGYSFKVIKKIFTAKIPRWLYRWVHPDLGIPIAKFWSNSSREKSMAKDEKFLGEDEILLNYCRKIEQEKHHDYYIFGHRHLPLQMNVSDQSTYYNLGEWFEANSYLEFDGKKASLLHFSDIPTI